MSMKPEIDDIMIPCTCSHGLQQHSWRNWQYTHCMVCATCGKASGDHVYQHHQWKRCDCMEYVAAQQIGERGA